MNFYFNRLFPLLVPSLIFISEKGVCAKDKFVEIKGEAVDGEYIFVMKNKGEFSVSAENFALNLDIKGVNDMEIFDKSVKGFVVKNINKKTASQIADNDDIDFVEQNQIIQLYQPDSPNEVDQTPATWGLDRIDERDRALNNRYNVVGDGTGITAYIIDTGIRVTHDEFKLEDSDESRAIFGVNTAGDSIEEDCNGHGTHVAGTVGGLTYGVAKNVELIAVKVFPCSGSATTLNVLEGIDWVQQHAQENGKTAVANLSLGGGLSQALNTAVRNLQNSGVVTVVAAGNSNLDACLTSPAAEPAVITVGATTNGDERSGFSNFGTCLDIFAPGSGITSAGIQNDSQTRVLSGTSMASPHVAGAAAILLERGVLPEDVSQELVSRATEDTLTDVGSGSVNKLLFVGEIGPTPAPTPCAGSTVIVKITTDNYPQETSWTLTNECTNELEASRPQGSYGSTGTFEQEECVPPGEYTFVISDSFGDGLCCSFGIGSYEVLYDEESVGSGDVFLSSEEVTFGGCSEPTLSPVTPVTLAPTSVPTLAPITPAPVTPAPITPAPVTPAPLTPAPVTPAPATPAPVTPVIIFEEEFEGLAGNFDEEIFDNKVFENRRCQAGKCLRLVNTQTATTSSFDVDNYTEVEISFIYFNNKRVRENASLVLEYKFEDETEFTFVDEYPRVDEETAINAIIGVEGGGQITFQFRASADRVVERFWIDNIIAIGID